MTLLIDVGNSAVKWARLDGAGALDTGGRALHRGAHDLVPQLQAAWRTTTIDEPAFGCSVAGPHVVAQVEGALRAAGHAPVRWLVAQREFLGTVTLVNGYRDPLQLGADRWHALLGAWAQQPDTSMVVVNAGTATTVDCLRGGEGGARFVGGCIAPGVRLMLESLARGTAGLPLATGEPCAFPDSTDRAIISGVLDAQAGLIERVWRRFAATLTHAPRLLLAGGHAQWLAAHLPGELAPVIEHNVVLRGLAVRAAVE